METSRPNRMAHSMDDAARLLGVSRRQVYRLLAAGRLRTVTLGRRRVVPQAALEELLGTTPASAEETRRGA